MYKITKCVSLPLKSGNKDFRPGNHEIPDLNTENWYVKALIRQGIVSIITKNNPKILEVKTPERQVETIVIKGPEVPPSMQVVETNHPDIVEIKPVVSEPKKEPEKTEDIQKKDIETSVVKSEEKDQESVKTEETKQRRRRTGN